jgi:hypothetical protein
VQQPRVPNGSKVFQNNGFPSLQGVAKDAKNKPSTERKRFLKFFRKSGSGSVDERSRQRYLSPLTCE